MIESVRIGRMTGSDSIKRTSWFVLCTFVFSVSAVRSTPELTLDDLRKLEIFCFVPSYLPDGFRLQRVDIMYDELHEEFDDPKHQLPPYSIVYSNDPRSAERHFRSSRHAKELATETSWRRRTPRRWKSNLLSGRCI
jgi:hypothetical protein